MIPVGPKILISGGAGYIGSHVSHCLRNAGFVPVVIDSLVNGHRWAVPADIPLHVTDVAAQADIRAICREHKPVAALHFAAFIEVGESVADPQKYLTNNFEKAATFFDILAEEGVRRIVFSSTAAVYGDYRSDSPITEDVATAPINPYGASKLHAETHLRQMSGVRSAVLRYFNVAGSAAEANLGEAHFPESHLIPRIVLPLIEAQDICDVLGLKAGMTIFGSDYPTRDGTAVRDYLHVMDLAEAHLSALQYLLNDGPSDIFNLGSGAGYSVQEMVTATKRVLDRPDFQPAVAPRRAGDPATLLASCQKAQTILGWRAKRSIDDMIASAAAWHRTALYRDTMLAKAAGRAL